MSTENLRNHSTTDKLKELVNKIDIGREGELHL
ncbi:hypothetical protein SAMN05216357_1248 [Porphyromonadaceae bacterium KH3CP3RA]|nr:hypothetical protein SAMN05216357_1248 [Porphyromonadaceae bacterium KH3CP3RA]